MPIEALYQALYWPTSGLDPAIGDDEIGNTDEDEFDGGDHGPGEEALEVLDAWGNPLVYFVRTPTTHRADEPADLPQREPRGGAPRALEVRRRVPGGFAEPRGFQIFSMGEDRQPNTDDDIKSWSSRADAPSASALPGAPLPRAGRASPSSRSSW